MLQADVTCANTITHRRYTLNEFFWDTARHAGFAAPSSARDRDVQAVL